MNPKLHSILITIGCFLWCASFFGEAFQGQPYSTIGIIVSPVLTVFGVLFWFRHYIANKGHAPKLETVWENTAFVGGYFTLDFEFLVKYFQEFLVCCMLIWMAMVLFMVVTFRNSDAFETTKAYCQQQQEILSKTGEIKYYGVLVGGEIYNKNQISCADLSFTIVGSKGNFTAKSKLTEHNGIWKVEDLNLK